MASYINIKVGATVTYLLHLKSMVLTLSGLLKVNSFEADNSCFLSN